MIFALVYMLGSKYACSVQKKCMEKHAWINIIHEDQQTNAQKGKESKESYYVMTIG